MSMDLNDFLEHHGVRGMKWGVRSKGRSSKGKTSKQTAAQKASHMSNEDLQKAVNRMRLEKQFSELSASKKASGKKFVKDVVKDVGKQHASKAFGAGLAAIALGVKKVLSGDWIP